MSDEIWKTIPSHPAYEASSLGRIRRVAAGRGAKAGRVIAQTPMNAGYLSVNLWENCKGRTRLVHRLVCEAFHGPIPDGLDVNHKNSNRTDNRPENLNCMTRKENIRHGMDFGHVRVIGEENPMAVITPEIVRAIRADHAAGLGYKRLAKKHGLTWGCVRSVATRRTWAHIE